MKTKFGLRFMATTILAFTAIYVLAQGLNFNGKWKGNARLPDGNTYPVTYNFLASKDTLTGDAHAEGDPKPLLGGKVNGNAFNFYIKDEDGTAMPHKCRYYPKGDSIVMDIDYQGATIHATLKRVTLQKSN
jgi:hypothetical protein